MGPVLFVIAIMGCGDGATVCAEARVVKTPFSTVEACQAAMPETLQTNTDLEYPELTATCRRTAPIIALTKIAPNASRASKQRS